MLGTQEAKEITTQQLKCNPISILVADAALDFIALRFVVNEPEEIVEGKRDSTQWPLHQHALTKVFTNLGEMQPADSHGLSLVL